MNFDNTYVKIDLDTIDANIDAIRARVGTDVMAVIKADAYGHGAVPLATFIEPCDYLWGFATATVDEAV